MSSTEYSLSLYSLISNFQVEVIICYFNRNWMRCSLFVHDTKFIYCYVFPSSCTSKSGYTWYVFRKKFVKINIVFEHRKLNWNLYCFYLIQSSFWFEYPRIWYIIISNEYFCRWWIFNLQVVRSTCGPYILWNYTR